MISDEEHGALQEKVEEKASQSISCVSDADK